MNDRIHSPRHPLALALLACASLLALAACKTRPLPTSEAVLEDALPGVVVPGVWSSAAEQGTVPDGWLASFGDATLEALVGEALRNNLDLRQARARLDSAAAAAGLAGAALKPVVDASGAVDAQTTSAERVTSRGVGLNLSWELDLWGRLRAQTEGAQANYEGAALDLEFARQSIAAATAKAWFLATESLQQQELTATQVATAEERVRVLEARRTAGKVGEQDVRLASAELSSAEQRRAAAEDAHRQALRALEALLGRYPSAELAAARELPALPAPVPAGLPSQLLQRRPDVAAAERRVRAAFKNVEVKELARLPSVSLTAGAGVSSELRELTGRSGFFGIGGNFFAPLLDGGAREADIAIATAAQESALAAYGSVALAAFLEVENALTSESTLAQREEFLGAALADGTEALRLRTLESSAGKADTLSVLQLQAQVDAARSGLLTLRQARRAERVNLFLALGGSFE